LEVGFVQSGISVFIGAVTDEKVKTAQIVKRIAALGGVRAVHEITGTMDILIEAQSDSLSQINRIVEEVRAADGVKSATTYLVLDTTPGEKKQAQTAP
jgi:DNA-binding Lrp family transcriptional regulator